MEKAQGLGPCPIGVRRFKSCLPHYFRNGKDLMVLSFISELFKQLVPYELKFEKFLKSLFEGMGYLVEWTKLSGDQGADLIIAKYGERIAVQAKRYEHDVTNKAVHSSCEVVRNINKLEK